MKEALISAGATVLVCMLNTWYLIWKTKRDEKKEREKERTIITEEHKKENEVVKTGLQMMIRLQLRYLSEEYLENGEISSDNLQDYIALYNAYHNLGSNGVMDTLYNKVLALPVMKGRYEDNDN